MFLRSLGEQDLRKEGEEYSSHSMKEQLPVFGSLRKENRASLKALKEQELFQPAPCKGTVQLS